MLATIGQPGLFPWWGTFAKAAISDIVIHLDHVNRQKGGYLNRFLISSPSNKDNRYWCTIPIKHSPLCTPIYDIQRINSMNFKDKHMDMMTTILGVCKTQKEEISWLISKVYDTSSEFVVDMAVSSTEIISEMLRVPCTFIRSTILNPKGSSTEMLIDILKKIGANRYLFGPGLKGRCQKYLDVSMMKKANIHVGLANYNNRARVSILQDLWCGTQSNVRDFPMTIEWL